MGVEREFIDQFAALHRAAYGCAFAVVGIRADAEDIAQEALARALVRWQKVREYGRAWVARVATNLALDHVRRLARRSTQHEQPHADAMWDQRQDLVDALRALPGRQREAVVLRFVVDLPEAEVALAMGCSVGTVKSSTSRGLAGLRTRLGVGWTVE